jgi:hypothetical protein
MNAYEQAAARIAATPELEPYRDAILYGWRKGAAHWHKGAAHYEWVATCDLAELLSWSQAVAPDAVPAEPGVPFFKGPAWDRMMAHANAEAKRLARKRTDAEQ